MSARNRQPPHAPSDEAIAQPSAEKAGAKQNCGLHFLRLVAHLGALDRRRNRRLRSHGDVGELGLALWRHESYKITFEPTWLCVTHANLPCEFIEPVCRHR